MVAQISTPQFLDAEQQKLRQQIGWQIAVEAAHLLQEKYQVSQVILFGSLIDSETICAHSDIDLAVWALADEKYYQALSDLQDLTSEFSFDLVQFETAQSALQHKIIKYGLSLDHLLLSSTHAALNMTNHQYALLIGQIQQELNEIEVLLTTNQRLLQKVRATQDEDYLAAIALNLHSFYTGAERIFKQIAQSIDRSVPDTADWHRQLLRQMTVALPNLRPHVITSETKSRLDEYCSFRHVVRNIYSTNLKFKRVQELAVDLPQCFEQLKIDLDAFMLTLANSTQ